MDKKLAETAVTVSIQEINEAMADHAQSKAATLHSQSGLESQSQSQSQIHSESQPHRKSKMRPERDPKMTHVYIVGGGIASLVAAVHLMYDAEVPANNIHILEGSNRPGGAMNSRNNSETGYSVRGTRKLNFTYHCLYDTLAKVPSGKDGRTILQEIISFNKYFNNPSQNKKTNPIRLVAGTESGPTIVDATKLSLEGGDKVKLLELLLKEEEEIGENEIQHWFSPQFTESLFWDLWCTMYGFQPWHSAQEFRRYLHRFLHEFPNLQDMSGIERTPMNDFESVILPMEKHLIESGVDFRYGTIVKSIHFEEESGDEIIVKSLNLSINNGRSGNIPVKREDIVLVTLGSMVTGSRTGSNTEAPPPTQHQSEITANPGPIWTFWSQLADPEANRHALAFGNPKQFYSRVANSSFTSFTTTLKNADFMKRLGDWAGSHRESYPLITFRDSPWLMSITIPNQPYFLKQPKDTIVIWGYGLFPDQDGVYVKKPMTQCTGREIFEEILGLLAFPKEMVEKSITIPVFMPFIGAPYVTRRPGDRPKVIPDKSVNLGLMGQFVEQDRDVTFTMEYSARSAQAAVFGLMGLQKTPHAVYRGDHSVKVLGEALKAIMG